ncbi:MAG: peptide chain release factor N(5)-glutamine methyltransferase [Ruminococcaceae bacterium]|nr:peptide chain release factor N(5)-glutamine methyltransferase [Oscillospiraceae bacterium]
MNFEAVKKKLCTAGIENASSEAVMLCEAFQGTALDEAVTRRCRHYPLQYILGKWAFYREEYEVDESCLIPRSDTEILVDLAINILPNGARFLDICTGSGCIAVSTLKNRTDTAAVGVDLFEKTLALATRNAAANDVTARFTPLLADATKLPPPHLSPFSFDAILSNPPYIESKILATLQREVQFEPRAALDGGDDGLLFYRLILENWSPLLKKDGFILFEIGYDQAQALQTISAQYGYTCTVKKDFGGNDRVCILKHAD